MDILIISSEAFEDNGQIPAKYTCDGRDVNPPLDIQRIPEGARTLALIMDDPDAPAGIWTHWVKWNIPITGTAMSFREEEEPDGIAGRNSSGGFSYHGPCPPNGPHRYFFKIYALDSELDLPEGADKTDLEKAMEGHILASGELLGVYSRNEEEDMASSDYWDNLD